MADHWCVVPDLDDALVSGEQSLAEMGGGWIDEQRHFYHLFSEPIGTRALYGFANEPPVAGLTYSTSAVGDQLTSADYHFCRMPEIKAGAGKIYNQWNDFDTGVAQVGDGAFIILMDLFRMPISTLG